MRHVRDEISPHRLEPSHAREVEEREHRAAARERSRRDREGASADHDLCAFGGLTFERGEECIAQRDLARQEVEREGQRLAGAEQTTGRLIDAHDPPLPVDRDHALI